MGYRLIKLCILICVCVCVFVWVCVGFLFADISFNESIKLVACLDATTSSYFLYLSHTSGISLCDANLFPRLLLTISYVY